MPHNTSRQSGMRQMAGCFRVYACAPPQLVTAFSKQLEVRLTDLAVGRGLACEQHDLMQTLLLKLKANLMHGHG